MNVPTMEVDRDYATRQLETYVDALGRSTDPEYMQVIAGLEQQARGRALIQLSSAIAAAGVDEDGYPRLAIARADRKQVGVLWQDRSTLQFNSSARGPDRRGIGTFDGGGVRGPGVPPGETYADLGLRMDVPWFGPFPEEALGSSVPWQTGARWSLVPMIPAQVRLEHDAPRTKDRDRFILWEVEEWFTRPFVALPDRDPLLLERIHDDLYAVIAAWDLTELEQAVMLGRRTA